MIIWNGIKTNKHRGAAAADNQRKSAKKWLQSMQCQFNSG